jgi:hypothetical protein
MDIGRKSTLAKRGMEYQSVRPSRCGIVLLQEGDCIFDRSGNRVSCLRHDLGSFSHAKSENREDFSSRVIRVIVSSWRS